MSNVQLLKCAEPSRSIIFYLVFIVMNIILYSPLEQFEVVPLILITAPIVGDFVLSLTNLGLYTMITVTIVLGLSIVGNNMHRLVPNA